MKCVLVFTVLFAAWLGSSEAATKCEDVIPSCAMGMSEITNAEQSKLKEACDAMHKVMTCFREGLKDCKEKNPNAEDQLAPIEAQMGNVEKLVTDNCGSGAGAVKISIALLLFAILSRLF